MRALVKWLRTYWSGDYDGPPMASDELGRKAADEIERLRAGFESEEEQTYVHNEVTGLHNMADLQRIERMEAVVDAARVYVRDSYRPEPKHDARRFDALEAALAALEQNDESTE